jgi:hypothetical protein
MNTLRSHPVFCPPPLPPALQLKNAILRNTSTLRRIYTYYSQLCTPPTPDNVYVLNRIRLLRLLVDCKLYQHGVSIARLDRACGKKTSRADKPVSAVHRTICL